METFSKAPPYDRDALNSVREWILSFISEENWHRRKKHIEKEINKIAKFLAHSAKSLADPHTAITIIDDRIGWYLYLVETFLFAPDKYEHYQGARILPIFARLGHDLALAKSITGVNEKIHKLLRKEKAQADSILFEILVATLWARNGWKTSFIPVTPNQKSPDLFAERDGESYYIECKRMEQSSKYAKDEKTKWLTMHKYVAAKVVELNLRVEIIFHVELTGMDDRFLALNLLPKLKPVSAPTKVISDAIWEVVLFPIDVFYLDRYVRENKVKNGSPRVTEFIGRERNR